MVYACNKSVHQKNTQMADQTRLKVSSLSSKFITFSQPTRMMLAIAKIQNVQYTQEANIAATPSQNITSSYYDVLSEHLA
jgi:hypothetical protein